MTGNCCLRDTNISFYIQQMTYGREWISHSVFYRTKIMPHHSWIRMMGKDSERLFSNHTCQGGFLSGRKCWVQKKAEVRINELGTTWWIPEWDDWPLIGEETPVFCHAASAEKMEGKLGLPKPYRRYEEQWSITEANEMRWSSLKDAGDTTAQGSVQSLESEKL